VLARRLVLLVKLAILGAGIVAAFVYVAVVKLLVTSVNVGNNVVSEGIHTSMNTLTPSLGWSRY
jgi:hypothetical protein